MAVSAYLVGGLDYIGLIDFPVTFNTGDAQQCFNITILDDFIQEANETFRINLGSVSVVIFQPTATVVIQDRTDTG